MTIEIKHPEALAIAKRGNSINWDMGDYLIKIAGKPSGVKDGSRAAIEEVSAELTNNGYPLFSVPYMGELRQAAFAFKSVDRVHGISWTTHAVAGTPEVLTAVIEAAKEQGRKGVSKRFVLDVINGMSADVRAKRKGAEIKARKIAEQAEKDRAKASRDKEVAKRRQDELGAKAAEKREQEATSKAERHRGYARKLHGAPKRDKAKMLKPPKPEEVPHLIAKTKFMRDSAEAAALVRRMDREITPHIDELSKAFIIGSVEELLEIAELFRKLAAKLNRNQIEKRAHLHAVGE